MARTVTADAEDFARFFFRLVEAGGGSWLTSRDVFEQAVAAYPTHPFVQALAEKPTRKGVFSTAAERIRKAEFAHVERRKPGGRRNAPVMYRAPAPAPDPGPEAAAGLAADQAEATMSPSHRGGLPARLPEIETVPALAEAESEARATLRHLRRCLERNEAERQVWWLRMFEPLIRAIARLQAVVAGR